MTRDDIKNVLAGEIGRIAPEVNFAEADPAMDLREAFEIDSMDFQNLVTALHIRLELPIPESDYEKLGTINAVLDYLEAETKAKS